MESQLSKYLNKCKYCNSEIGERFNIPIIDKHNDNLDYLYVDIGDSELRIEVQVWYESLIDSVEINYCPMCGRFLE